MKENIQNQGQQKTAKNLKKVQNLKVAVATALGLTAGTGVVIAADQLLNNEDVVAEPAVEKEEVAAAAKPEPQPEPQPEPKLHPNPSPSQSHCPFPQCPSLSPTRSLLSQCLSARPTPTRKATT